MDRDSTCFPKLALLTSEEIQKSKSKERNILFHAFGKVVNGNASRHYQKCWAELERLASLEMPDPESYPMTEEEAFLYCNFTENFITDMKHFVIEDV